MLRARAANIAIIVSTTLARKNVDVSAVAR
jgi:hypothetical protein